MRLSEFGAEAGLNYKAQRYILWCLCPIEVNRIHSTFLVTPTHEILNILPTSKAQGSRQVSKASQGSCLVNMSASMSLVAP